VIKVTYIISDINKALAFEWVAEYLDKQKFTISFILLNPGGSVLEEHLINQSYTVYGVCCRGKKDWPSAIGKTYRLLKKIKPDVIHCHLLQANIIGLTAAKLAGIKRRIYTRHHSSLHHVYFKKGVWGDKLANKLATDIVAISGVVKKILIDWERVGSEKVILIPHGFLLEYFQEVTRERIDSFRARHQLKERDFVIGVISRLTEWKGVQYIIPGFERFLKIHPRAILLLLNAKGDFETKIQQLLNNIPAENYRLIVFENDIAAAYKAMDVFVHTPIDEHSEAFGQTYVEALAAEVPSIFTRSGIATDFIVDQGNALVVPFKDSEAVFEKIKFIYDYPELARKMALQGKKDVNEKFGIDKMISALEELYG
jgi:glycosyltransferase involved in cell wall biosynthesis